MGIVAPDDRMGIVARAASALADVRLVVLWRLRATQLLFEHERPAFPPD